MQHKILIIGGGAAGFFAAIAAAESNPSAKVVILEKGREVLQKVKVSGGGRCNVTHHCFEPKELVKNYPRGAKALLGPFHKFGPTQTIEWFRKRGVKLKTEADGRMFPLTDNSGTIIHCLTVAAQNAGVEVLTGQNVTSIETPIKPGASWLVKTQSGQSFYASAMMIATGSSPRIWEILKELGHQIVPPVPSLFTFNIKDKRIEGLLGLSVPMATVRVEGTKLSAEGPLLITHWGMSGPAILKLSAWGARDLSEKNHRFEISVNWLGNTTLEEMTEGIKTAKSNLAKKTVEAGNPTSLPQRLWKSLVAAIGIPSEMRWADLGKENSKLLVNELVMGRFQVNGKSTFKEEFVTAGGVKLNEVDFRTFESKLQPGLFFAGEVLDIDAVTGGFNFQAAWTGGWLAGQAMAL